MKSQNFEFLRHAFPELADLGGFAERYVFADPASALLKLRLFAESMVSAIYSRHQLPRPYQFNLNDMLNDDMFVSMIPKPVCYKLHQLRIQGNKAAHGADIVKPQIPAWLTQEGVKLVGIRVAQDRRGLKAYRAGTRPVVRGTFWKISPRAAYLWASGFKPVLRVYDGWDVPEPLRIEIQHGEADIRQVAIDIFGLTKLNYNACKLGESQPVTVHFSDAVGEILVANQGAKHFLPNFKYYV